MTLRTRLLVTLVALMSLGLVVSDVIAITELRSYLVHQTDEDLADYASRLQVRPAARFQDGATSSSMPSSAGTNEGVGTSTIARPDHEIAEDAATSTSTVALALPTKAAAASTSDDAVTCHARSSDATSPGYAINSYFVDIRTTSGHLLYCPDNQSDSDAIPRLTSAAISSHMDGSAFTVGSLQGARGSFRAVAIPLTNGVATIATSLQPVHNTLDRLELGEFLATMAILALLGMAGWYLVRNDLRPLEDMATTAGAIANGDLSQRVQRSDDTSEVGRLGKALNTMLSRIEQSFAEQQAGEERLRRFAADASHELRTPLTAIRGYAEMYRQGAVSSEEHLSRIMGRIEGEAARMGLMVEDLLLLARLDQNRPLDSDEVDLCAIARDVTEDASVAATSHPITIDSSVDALHVMGDGARLHQVLVNLVGNAQAHTPPGTPIHVHATEDDGYGVVSVSDEGPGLTAEAAEKVFERFYRVDAGRTRNTGGTGLGLAIVKAIVEAHGGNVAVESTPGKGATFRFRIPLRSDAGTAPPTDEVATPGPAAEPTQGG